MKTVNLRQLPMKEFKGETDPKQHCVATFPVTGVQGSLDTASVYFELEPGEKVGRHTDSAEELLVILEGKVKVTVGDESRTAQAESLALVPKMVPHNIENIGETRARVLGVFGGANHIVATFEDAWLPERSHVVDTRLVLAQ